MARIAILGSGASAVAVAAYFAGNKQFEHRVDVIDFGSNSNTSAQGNEISGRLKKTAADYLFSIPDLFKISSSSGSTLGSAAYGGWAEAWGATAIAFNSNELSEMAFDYSEFMSFQKELVRRFPYFNADLKSRRVPDFFSALVRNSKDNQNVNLVQSRLALNTLSQSPETGCIQCGKCLTGCEYGHIWRPSIEWPKIFKNVNFCYRPGLWVESIREDESEILVTVESLSGSREEFSYDYVFCGLGPIQSAALMIRSGVATRDRVSVHDSQMILFPFMDKHFRRMGQAGDRIALSEGFLSSRLGDDQTLTDQLFAQLYFYSNSLEQAILERFWLFRFIPVFLRRIVFSRIGIAMVFLDQGRSGILEIEKLENSIRVNLSTFERDKSSNFRLINESFKSISLRGINFLSQISKIGEGYHFGASFPYGRDNQGNTSDKFGRPNGLFRLSIVDASSLPRITSTPPTFNVMINAMRIASSVNLRMLKVD